ncbi:hypothetical protein ACNKHR_09770 [Shigella flexneri]
MLPYFYSCVDLIRFEGVDVRDFVSLICSVLGCAFCFIALMGASSFNWPVLFRQPDYLDVLRSRNAPAPEQRQLR